MVQCAGGTHRLAHQHAIEGAGLKPAPSMHAVTGMIGDATAGERAGIVPSQTRRARDDLAHRRLGVWVEPIV